jgi:thymidine kinase
MSANTSKSIGRLDLILGPMFGGKSTELARRYRRKEISGANVLMVNSGFDTRASQGGNVSRTHDGKGITSIGIKSFKELDARKEARGATELFVDEGQFITDPEHLLTLLDRGVNVTVSSLDSNSDKVPFSGILGLVPHATTVQKLNAVCEYCGSDDAIYSLLRSGKSNGKVQIGGKETYIVCCRKCSLLR